MKGGARCLQPERSIFKEALARLIWLFLELLLRLRYKIVYEGTEHLPREGALLMMGNHVSLLDWFLVQLPLKRQIHYLIERSYYEKPLLRPFLRLGGVIPVSARASKEALAQTRVHLGRGEVVGIFPEGQITLDGKLCTFRRGFEVIANGYNGRITPFYIEGMYGSRFSYASEHFVSERSGWRRMVKVRFAPPLPLHSSSKDLRRAIENLKESHGTQQA